MIKISPSMLACDFSRMGDEAAAMERAGAEMLHLDVMDGHFVPNLSFGAPVIAKLRPYFSRLLDVHLMISEPLRYIADFASAGADIITFHVESGSDVTKTIESIKSYGIVPALSIKPDTPPEAVEPWLPHIGMVLVMTVEPGFGGQAFFSESARKCRALFAWKKERQLSFDIQVDGGIDVRTAPIAVSYGANVLVAGSALFSNSDYAVAIGELRQAAKTALNDSHHI